MPLAVLKICQKCSSNGIISSAMFQPRQTVNIWKRCLFYKKKYIFDRGKWFNIFYGEHQDTIYSPEGLSRFLRKRDMKKLEDKQRVNAEVFSKFGPDVAVASFVMKFGGRVKLKDDTVWLTKLANLYGIPRVEVEGIDASNMILFPQGLDNLRYLDHLRYLKFGVYATDWYLFHLQALQDSLEYVDLTDCKQITEAGLASLNCLRKLKYLDVSGCTRVQNPEVVAIQLENLIPDLVTMGLETLPQMDETALEKELEQSRFLKMGESVEHAVEEKKLIGDNTNFNIENSYVEKREALV